MHNKIDHDIRNHAKLSLLDYCLLDSIYQLSTTGKEQYKTWCNISKKKLNYLGCSKTIVNAYNRLEKKGYLEFYDEKRYLKRTTKKYYSNVRAYIEGVKELHPPCVNVTPNNNIYTNKDTNINKVGKPTFENLEEDALKKNESEKERKKVAAKKESKTHIFPSNVPLKSFDTLAKFDRRTNSQLPFDSISAFETMKALYPEKKKALNEYNSVYSESAEMEVIEKAWKTFIEKRFSNNYQQIRTVSILKKNFFEWIKNQVKYKRSNELSKKRSKFKKSTVVLENDLIDYNEDRDRQLREESRKSM